MNKPNVKDFKTSSEYYAALGRWRKFTGKAKGGFNDPEVQRKALETRVKNNAVKKATQGQDATQS